MKFAITHIKEVAFILLISFLVCSCEQIIQVKLNEGQPNVVIESSITTGRGPFSVKLSQSQAYYNQSNFVPIEKALVQMDDSAVSENLTENGSGYYSTRQIRGTAGNTYHLNVTTGGKKY